MRRHASLKPNTCTERYVVDPTGISREVARITLGGPSICLVLPASHPLDVQMKGEGYRMVRYADDFVILCSNREDAMLALEKVRRWVEENGLTLHPDKMHVGDCRQPGEGFDFLGYRFEAGQRQVRKKSLQRLKEKIRERTRRTRGDSLAQVVSDLNPILKGWFGYFKHAHERTNERLARLMRKSAAACARCYANRKSVPPSGEV